MLIIGAVFVLVGLIFGVFAIMIGLSQSGRVKRSTTVKAVVTDLKYGHGVAPIVSYQYQGKEYSYQSNVFTRPGSYKLEEQIDLLVDSKHPEKPLLNTFSERWLLPSVLGGLGALFLILGAIFVMVG